MGRFAPAGATSIVKSVQEGYVASTTPSTGSGEDANYVDVTISSVDTSKTLIFVSGSGSPQSSRAGHFATASTSDTAIATGRLTSATNLRISCLGRPASAGICARWRVVEYN